MSALIICVTIHEFAHAYSAWRAGDDTPRAQGRISINPLDHLDPLGTIMMVVTAIGQFGIGWGKPVQVNPHNFRHPRWDNLRVSLWGPLSNILTAAVMGLTLRFFAAHMPPNVLVFAGSLTAISITLAVFNLLPVTPLDGSHIVSALLPIDLARRYDMAMGQYGLFIFLALVFLGGGRLFDIVLAPPVRFLWGLFTGSPW